MSETVEVKDDSVLNFRDSGLQAEGQSRQRPCRAGMRSLWEGVSLQWARMFPRFDTGEVGRAGV